MTLHQVRPNKEEKQSGTQLIKQKSKELRKKAKAKAKPTQEQLAKPAKQICSGIGKGMSRVNRQGWKRHPQNQNKIQFNPIVPAPSLPLQLVGTLAALSMIGAPRILMQLVVLITNFNGVMPMDLHLCEFLLDAWRRLGGV